MQRMRQFYGPSIWYTHASDREYRKFKVLILTASMKFSETVVIEYVNCEILRRINILNLPSRSRKLLPTNSFIEALYCGFTFPPQTAITEESWRGDIVSDWTCERSCWEQRKAFSDLLEGCKISGQCTFTHLRWRDKPFSTSKIADNRLRISIFTSTI